jgi:hypothetical protein
MEALIFKTGLGAMAALCATSAVARDVELKIQTAPGVDIAGTLSRAGGVISRGATGPP